jgi:hypothetical protein
MVFEDAHWIDPTSRELLDLTVERVGSFSVLLIVGGSGPKEPHLVSRVSAVRSNADQG